jgi:predicted tellurium resistance membrane protein TerC
MFDFFTSPTLALSLLTLTCLELVLGIDNLIFISIAISRLPSEQQNKARYIGLSIALLMRLTLLYASLWLTTFTQPLFTIMQQIFSVRDLFLLMGGLFLIVKATNEIHVGIVASQSKPRNPSFRRFSFVLGQIVLLDLVFSFDSIMTAVGLTNNFIIMAIAIMIAILLMMLASQPIHHFINKYPSLKVLALSFLLLIGMSLLASGMHFIIPHGFIYFAMLFSLAVEILNIITGKRDEAKNKW